MNFYIGFIKWFFLVTAFVLSFVAGAITATQSVAFAEIREHIQQNQPWMLEPGRDVFDTYYRLRSNI